MTLLLAFTFLAIGYIQAGYACALWFLASRRAKKAAPEHPMPTAVSIVLCIHNGGGRIQERLRNLHACKWDGEREFIVFCDGCDDDSATLAANPAAAVRDSESVSDSATWAEKPAVAE